MCCALEVGTQHGMRLKPCSHAAAIVKQMEKGAGNADIRGRGRTKAGCACTSEQQPGEQVCEAGRPEWWQKGELRTEAAGGQAGGYPEMGTTGVL